MLAFYTLYLLNPINFDLEIINEYLLFKHIINRL